MFCIFQWLSTTQRKCLLMHYIRYGNSVFAKFIQHLKAICVTGCRIKRSHVLFVGKLQKLRNFDTQAADITRTFRLCTNLGEITWLKLTTGRKSLVKQQILEYKTPVYTLVNGIITHQKQQISKRWYCSAVHWHLSNVVLRNITLSVYDV